MRSVGLLLKVLWAPGEAMFLLSKNPRVLVPILFVALSSLLSGIIVTSKVPAGELAMRVIERSPQGANLSDEAKEQIRQRVNSPAARTLTIGSTSLGPPLLLLVVAGGFFLFFFLFWGRRPTEKKT